MRGVAPRSRSHKSQTSGARRRCGQRWAGVTRSAAKWAFHGRLVPLRHVTTRHARRGNCSAIARTARAFVIPLAEDGQMRRDPEGVGKLGAVEVLTQRPVVPEFRIAQHRRDLHAAGPHLPHQRERQAPFLLEAHRRGDSRTLPRVWRQPLLGHIQGRAQHPRAHARPQRRGDRDLTVGDLAQACRNTGAPRRPSVDPASENSSRRESRRRSRSWITARSCRQTRSALHGACGNEVLERLIGARIGHALEHRAHRLAPAVAQQPEQIATEGTALRHVREADLERLEPRRSSGRATPARCAAVATAPRRQRTEVRERSTRSLISVPVRSRSESADLTKRVRFQCLSRPVCPSGRQNKAITTN